MTTHSPSLFWKIYYPWFCTALSKPVTWTKMAQNKALCFSSCDSMTISPSAAIYQLAFMTCLWVPGWQSSLLEHVTHSPDAISIHSFLFLCCICPKYSSLTTFPPPPSSLFFSFSLMVCSGQQSTFFLSLSPLPHPHPPPPLYLSPFFPHWSKVLFLPPPCFCVFFRGPPPCFLPSLYPFIFPNQLWAEKFWQTL